jgi:hypothetical protein
VKLRIATYEDYDQIRDLHLKNDIKILKENNWINFWKQNPLLKKFDNNYPIGWVLTEKEKIVGYLGNIVKEYYHLNKLFIVACSHAWIVDKKYKLESLTLINIFFSQKNIDVFITTTPNKTAEKLFLRYGAKVIPLKNYNENLFLILNTEKFVDSFTKYKKLLSNKILKLLILNLFKITMTNKINFWKKFIQKRKINLHYTFDKSFEYFWNEYKNKNDKFIQSKSPNWLNWHIDNLKDAWVISISENDKIKGYALCSQRNNETYDLKRISIIDVVTIGDDVDIYPSLIKGCIEESYKRGYHVIDMIGTGRKKKKMFANFKTFKRTVPNFLFYYYSKDLALSNLLVNEIKWDPTLLDGDSFLI